MDLTDNLRNGQISVGLYHTAGKGTRMAPLPGAENNNKPGVKLPASIPLGDGRLASITILEAVIKQTGCYAKSRMGRLSVFWGDQVFIPTVPVEYTVTHHADILCSLGPMLDEVEWKEKGMDKYGLIAQSSSGGAAQVEKVDHATAVKLLGSLGGEIESVGASLGSFSVSSALLQCLLVEFASELARKEGKLDSDPHLWMPMTLERGAYQQLMAQKGVAAETSGAHFDRIAAMMGRFLAHEENRALGVFGPVNVGQGVYWWDYGQLRLYQRYALLSVESSKEAELMRLFFGMTEAGAGRGGVAAAVEVTGGSCVTSSSISSGHVRGSVLSGVRCLHLEAQDCVLVNVTASRIVAAPGSVIYNVCAEGAEGLVAAEGEVLAGVFAADGSQQIIRSHLSIDGGKAWEAAVAGNLVSFEQVYASNADVSPLALEAVISARHAAVASSF